MGTRRPAFAIACVASALFTVLLAVAPARAVVTFDGDFNLDFTDIHVTGGLGMQMTRVYNSFTDRKGIFGYGWSSKAEDYLKVQDDGSIIVHEYGGGADNRFTPTTSTLRPQKQILDEIMGAAEKAGQFGSESDRAAYRQWLEASDDNEEEAWENFISLGLLKSEDPPVGATFFSGRFATEFLTRVPEGYQRESTYNGQTIFEAFDLSGRLTRFWDANHAYVALTYGPDGHLKQTSDNEGNRFLFVFTPDGFVKSITNTRGYVVTYTYTNSDLRSADVNGSVTRFDYDSDDRLTAIRYSDHTSMQMGYSSDGLTSLVKDIDGTVTTYVYASHDSQTSRVDTVDMNIRKTNGETHHTTNQYFYDAPDFFLDKWIETQDGVATDTTYDRNRDPLTITTSKGTTTNTYDSLGRRVREQTADGTVYTWEYDPSTDKVATATTTGKTSVLTEHFQYDPKGNMARAYDSDGHDFTISYDPYGRIAAVTGSTIQLTFQYADNTITNPADVALGGVGTVQISYLASGAVQSAKGAGGDAVVAKVRAALKTVDDLVQAAGVDVITLPAPST